ncbi:MAG: transglycosylase SLT domain-containing protein [Saprospiraceae bacterium]|nr:transglycosylase SLT domain-containing protein [Saprospiraceae bacterium]
MYNQTIKTVFLIFILLPLFLNTGNANISPKNSAYHERVYNLNTVIDVKMNSLVEEQIDLIVNKKRKDSQYILGRTSLFFPKIENALREKGLPDELKYIAVIESSLRPDAVSSQGAAGIWQFMKGTAKLYGLEISKYIDERRDVELSTEKALLYLSTLYDIYGNWTTALAAYNCGPGNINKAIKKANGSTNYWELAKYLPKETKEYIPRFIAASYLMNYYYLHDITPIEPENEFKYTGAVRVYEKVYFKDLVSDLNIDMELVKRLNPIYLKEVIPASNEGKYLLILPESTIVTYLDKTQSYHNLVYLASIPHAQKDNLVTEISSDETNSESAYHIKTNLSYVLSIKSTAGFNIEKKKTIKVEKKMHQMKKKESLSEIAGKNNLSLTELLALNGFSETDEISLNSSISIMK